MTLLSYLKDKWQTNNFKLYVYIFCLLAFTSVDYILYVNWVDTMSNYNWYAGSFIFPLIGCIFFWIPTWYMQYIQKEKFVEEKKIQQKDLVKIGILDSLNSILGTLATPFLSIVMMTITDKIQLPLMMLASYFLLKRRYHKSHYLGCILTIYGVMVAFVPDFESNRPNNYLWLFIYILSILPAVASFSAKEAYLKKDTDLSICWLNSWISLWQLLFGLITFPVLFIPLPAPSGNNIKPYELGAYFINATKCQFGGVNSQLGDKCTYSFLILFTYQIINTIVNVLMFLIIREGSSVNFIIVNALKSPITAWIGSNKSIAGKHAQNISISDFFSFIAIFIGAIVYNHNYEILPIIPLFAIDDDFYMRIDNNSRNNITLSEIPEEDEEYDDAIPII